MLKLVHSQAGQNVAKIRRNHTKYKEYVKYRASIKPETKNDIFSFQEWLKDDYIFRTCRYF